MASSYFDPNKDHEFNIDGQDLPSCAKDYLKQERRINHLSPLSVRNYYLALRTFLTWLSGRQTGAEGTTHAILSYISEEELKALTSEDIEAFIDYCRTTRRNGPSALSGKLSVLNSFFDYCVSEACILAYNPAAGISRHKYSTRPSGILSAKEALMLIAACDKGETPARDVCIATLMLNCGIRISEAVALDLSDLENDTLTVRGSGKRKDRILTLNADCMQALGSWISERKAYGLTDNALFVSRRYDSRLTERAVQQMLAKAVESAGLSSKGITPHNIRLTAGYLMYMSGKFSISEIQDILGHKSAAFAERYAFRGQNGTHSSMKNFRIR